SAATTASSRVPYTGRHPVAAGPISALRNAGDPVHSTRFAPANANAPRARDGNTRAAVSSSTVMVDRSTTTATASAARHLRTAVRSIGAEPRVSTPTALTTATGRPYSTRHVNAPLTNSPLTRGRPLGRV